MIPKNLVQLASALLKQEEGFSALPYYCTEGYPTIGYGQRLGPKDAPLDLYELVITKQVGLALLEQRLTLVYLGIKQFPFFAKANESRQVIFISMAYQLGIRGLCGFKKMIEAVENNDWDCAANEALDSKWAKHDSPARANRS